jgi:SAM-dependent methyltransferase
MTAEEAIAANPRWYHSIELAPGVLTPGMVDLRPLAPRVLPSRISGRALDIGTFDGFWAFELERRGADEVVALDVGDATDAEWPPLHRERLERQVGELGVELGLGFRLAAGALESRVERVVGDVRTLSPEDVGGAVDVAFLGSLLLHLRDPVGALERIRATLQPGGTLFALEPVALRETLLSPRRPVAHFRPLETSFNWWEPNLAALKAWVHTAGFERVRFHGFHKADGREHMDIWLAALEAS